MLEFIVGLVWGAWIMVFILRFRKPRYWIEIASSGSNKPSWVVRDSKNKYKTDCPSSQDINTAIEFRDTLNRMDKGEL